MIVPGSANPLLLRSAVTQYQVSRSLRFNSSDSGYCSRVPSTAGNRKTWTWAGWVKRSALGSNNYLFTTTFANANAAGYLYFNASNLLTYWDRRASADGIILATNSVFRDVSAWYHVVLSVDYSNATAANRARLYVNGVEQTYSSNSYPSTTEDSYFNAATAHYISSTSGFIDGYLADVYFIDGQALTPSSFTEVSATTGQLIPKAYTGTFGTNGFWLKLSDNSNNTATTLGKDYSPNGNNWTPNNLSVTAGAGNDSLVDTPTSYGTGNSGGDVRGNYCTWNPLTKGSNVTLANGNLDAVTAGTGSSALGTIGISSGKWYFEGTQTGGCIIGVANSSVNTSTNPGVGLANSWTWYSSNTGVLYFVTNGSFSGWTLSKSLSDVLQIAVDATDITSIKVYAGVNNVWYNSSGGTTNAPDAGGSAIATITTGVTVFPIGGAPNYTNTLSINFGQRPFAYTAPSGFKALCDTNLPAPVVAKGSSAFDALLYTGNGASRSITGLSFNPDLVWIKERNAAADHALYDAVRGAQIRLESNTTDAEVATDGGVTAFNSDGFSLGTLAQVNTNADTYVAWAWDAGSSTVTNTQGSITSSVRANASAGFSIVTYTGNGTTATVGHGLGVAPYLMIHKARNLADFWLVYHGSLGASTQLNLSSTSAALTGSTKWNSTAPSSTVFTVTNDGSIGQSGINYVTYCFAPVAGYSSFGSYTGNGSADGPFVYTGFRPRWLLIKNASVGTDSWQIWDAARSDYNAAQKYLLPNTSGAEGDNSAFAIDFTSNGFKVRNTNTASNGNTNTLVFAAFAESPFAYARAR